MVYMPAPKRLVTRLGDMEISAFVLPEVEQGEADKITCRFCSPKATKNKLVAQLVLFRRRHEMFYNVFECQACKRQWALPFVVIHESGVGE